MASNGNIIGPQPATPGGKIANPDGTVTLIWNSWFNQVVQAPAKIITGATPPFNQITTGTNTTAIMTVGSGATINAVGSGAIDATSVPAAGIVGTISNGQLANDSVTIAAGPGLTGGGSVALGSTVTFSLNTPTTSQIGGVEAVNTVAHEWIDSISTAGVPHLSQPAFTDVSGIAAVAQGGTGTASPALVAGTGISITGSWPDQTITNTGASATPSFSTLSSGTNTSAAMTVGSGAALAASGSGTIAATSVPAGGITGTISNGQLANSSITISTTSPLTGGGTVSLGGSLTLALSGSANWTTTGLITGGALKATSAAATFAQLVNTTSGLTYTIYSANTAANGFNGFAIFDGSSYQLKIIGSTWMINGTVGSYNGQSTVNAGIPAEYAQVKLANQSANISSTTLYSVPGGPAWLYRVTAYVVLSQAATVSSTLPNAQILYTDQDTGASVTLDITPLLSAAGLGQTGALTANTVGTVATGVVAICAKASTTISYQTVNYASSGATSMQYSLRITLEAL